MNAFTKIEADERLAARRGIRRRIRFAVGGSDYDGDLVDISSAGVRALVAGPVRVGALVSILLFDGLQEEAVVAWQQGGLVGCHFIAPLGDAELAGLAEGAALSSDALAR